MVLLSNTGLIVCKMAVYIIKIRNCQFELKKKLKIVSLPILFSLKKNDNCHNFYLFF